MNRRRLRLGLVAIALIAGAVGVALIVGPAKDGGLSGSFSPPVEARERAARYLLQVQNRDGGFGEAPGQPSAQIPSAWVGLGLAAAGRNLTSVSRGGHSLMKYIGENTPSPTDAGAFERSMLVARAAGLSAPELRQRNSYRNLLRQRTHNGSFKNLVNLTAFGVLAMSGADEQHNSDRVRRSVTWLSRQQNSDGGFGFSARPAASDVDDTAAALQALAAGGQHREATVDRGIDYLLRVQRSDGGFGQTPGQTANAQSTAWAVQGLVAVGGDRTASAIRRALTFLRSLQSSDGSIRYSQRSAQTPVWVTGQALLALARQPLPVEAPSQRR